MRSKQQAFTLIELSVTLLIMGLLIGGLMVGRSMVRAAQLREVLAEYDHYVKSLQEFQDKFQALPGDMSTAESMWGTASGGCPGGAGTGTQTCNGNGDGHIGSSDGAWGTSNTGEWCRSWQQMAIAGLVEGSFTGYGCDSAPAAGVNLPMSKLSGAVWRIFYHLQSATDGALWADEYNHLLNLSGTAAYSAPYAEFGKGVISAVDVHVIDNKIDDGAPGTGTVRVLRTAVSANCTLNDSSQAAATYNSTDTLDCSPFFKLGF